jgi:predicted nucleic acid-binding protein
LWGDRLGVDINPILPGTPPDGYDWGIKQGEQYIPVIAEIAEASSRGIIEPGQAIAVCPGYADNRDLEYAAASESVLIVSDDTDLASMSSWRRNRYSQSCAFAKRTDLMRQGCRC